MDYHCLYLGAKLATPIMAITTANHTPRLRHNSPSIDLSSFAITNNAFLPEKSLPKALSDPYYAPWEIIIQHLPEHIRNGTIREVISRLPVLSTAQLRSEAEWQRAYTMLAYLTSAHTWGGDQPEEVGKIHNKLHNSSL